MQGLTGRMAGKRPYLLLILLCLVLYLPGIAAIPVLDRDEARFAQASRQMLETGDFLNIRFQDEARNKKPAGIYWLQAASVSLFSTAESRAIWPYRVPSLIGATGAVLLTFAFGHALLQRSREDIAARPTAFAAAAILAGSLAVMAEAHIAKTDAMLLAAAAAAQGALGLAYLRGRSGEAVGWWVAVVFWAAQAAATLLKGPPVPLLSLATIAMLAVADRGAAWLRGLRPLPGLLLIALILSPWLIAIQRATAGRFLGDSLGHDLMAKLVGAQEAHGAPPLYYLVLLPVTFWPGSLLLVPGLVRAWRRRREVCERFLLAWIVPSWALLELVPTKLPHYALPLYPALALLAALPLFGDAPARSGWASRLGAGVRGLWAIITLLLATALIVLPLRFGDRVSAVGIVGAVALVVLGAVLLSRSAQFGAIPLLAGLSAAFAIAAGWGVLPGLDRLWLSREAARLEAAHPRPAGAPFATVGYNEPSLVFLLGGDIRASSAEAAADTTAGGGQALVSNREEAGFRAAVTARGSTASPLGSVTGLDYSNGQRLTLTLYGRLAP